MKRDQTYQVVSRSAVTVEFANGNVMSYPAGFMFTAHATNASVTRLLRNNSIRMVTPREVPTFAKKIDTTSSSHPAKAAPTPAAAKKSKKTEKTPTGGGE
jgi:hypothetical protein